FVNQVGLSWASAGIVRIFWGCGANRMSAEAEVGTEAPAKKGMPKLFIILGAAAIVTLIAGAGLFFFLSSSGSSETGAEGAHGGAASAAAHETFIFNLPPMMVNLNGGTDGQSFMKLTIALEVADESMMSQIQPRLP